MQDNIQNNPGFQTNIQNEQKPKSQSLIMLENLQTSIEENITWQKNLQKDILNNTEQYSYFYNKLEILRNQLSEIDFKFRNTNEWYKKANDNLYKVQEGFINEHERRLEFLKNIPKTVNVHLDENNMRQLDRYNKQNKFLNYLFYSIAGLFILGVSNLFLLNRQSIKWYSESIKSRQEMLKDYQLKGNTIVSIKMLDSLKDNNEMILQYIRKNPKESQDLVNFARGYHSKK